MSIDVTIGYWGQGAEDGLPMPVAGTALPDQSEIIAKLKALMTDGHWTSYRGWSNCRLCGKHNGSKELAIIRGETKYRIPEGYLHYLEDHHVAYDPRLLELISPNRMSMPVRQLRLTEDQSAEDELERLWSLGEYVEQACQNCGRQRLCICPNGKHRCEKCNWVPEDGAHAPVR